MIDWFCCSNVTTFPLALNFVSTTSLLSKGIMASCCRLYETGTIVQLTMSWRSVAAFKTVNLHNLHINWGFDVRIYIRVSLRVHPLTCCGSKGPYTGFPGGWSPWRWMWWTAPVSCTPLCSLWGNKTEEGATLMSEQHSLLKQSHRSLTYLPACVRERHRGRERRGGRGRLGGRERRGFLWICANVYKCVCICREPSANTHRDRVKTRLIYTEISP